MRLLDIFTTKLLGLPVGIYSLPVIVFLIIASATYQNSKLKVTSEDEDDNDETTFYYFDKPRVNWVKAFMAGAFLFLIILIADLLKGLSDQNI